MNPWRAVDTQSGYVVEPWRAGKPVVTDLHHFDEEQDPDPNSDPGSALK
jgi:hypothetical protein